MRLLVCFLLFTAVSCSDKQEHEEMTDTFAGTERTEMKNDETVDVVLLPDRSVYIDERIAEDVMLKNPDPLESVALGTVYAEVNDFRTKVEQYEGTLMKATGHPEGFSLRFAPYNHYDHKLEQEIKSAFDFELDVVLTKEQNEVLGFVDYSKQTKNLAWDYFENLFKIYYYSKGGNCYPLKFENLGKTEWDG